MSKNLDFNDFDFKNRDDAALKLIENLPSDMLKKDNFLLLALSGGGAKIASNICEELKLEFDLFFIAPILAPKNDECEIAMVSHTQEIVTHDALIRSFEIDENYIYEEAKRLYEDKIIKWNNRYRKGELLPQIKDRCVLLVDEGCETGLSTMCAIKSVLNLGANKVSLAIPVIADDLFHQFDLMVDEIFTVHKKRNFISTSYYYEELEKIKSKELLRILGKSRYFMINKKES